MISRSNLKELCAMASASRPRADSALAQQYKSQPNGYTFNHQIYAQFRLARESDVPHLHKLIYHMALLHNLPFEATEASISNSFFKSQSLQPFVSFTALILEVSPNPFAKISDYPIFGPSVLKFDLEKPIIDTEAEQFRSSGQVDSFMAGYMVFYTHYFSFLKNPGICVDNLYIRTWYRSMRFGIIMYSAVASHATKKGYSMVDQFVNIRKHANGVGEEVFLQLPKIRKNVFDEKKNYQVIGVNEASKRGETCLTNVLLQYQKILTRRRDKHLGYPFNMDCEPYLTLAPLLGFHINNLGDPFIDSNYGLHSKPFEVAVLNWFAELWEIEKDDYWGYMTNGGTEGNLHGILLGRELRPEGILYASRESHYSVFKAARMYRMKCEIVDTMVTGEIDCMDLEKKLLLNKDKPAIINVNIGTTFKGGLDDLDSVIQILEDCGFSLDRFYIHCDTALSGLIIPFVKSAPKITFKKPIGSVTISGHKFLGCPMPCGVQMTRKKHIDVLSRNVEYIGSLDATISGSRNGHTSIFMWYNLSKKGHMGLQEDVKKCLTHAQYLKNRLQSKGFWALCNEVSTTVVFDRPLDNEFVLHWQLACQENMAHIIVMPNITIQVLDNFVAQLPRKQFVRY